jgi:hypothetical protein
MVALQMQHHGGTAVQGQDSVALHADVTTLGEVKPEYGESFPPDLSCLLYPVAPTSQVLRHVQFTPILGLEQIFC